MPKTNPIEKAIKAIKENMTTDEIVALHDRIDSGGDEEFFQLLTDLTIELAPHLFHTRGKDSGD